MEQYNYMPIGTVVSYAGATTPIGWLLCDGRTIEEHEYPDLYRVLGSGVLPDLRGEFVRGLDNGRGLDEGRVLGSEQGDAIRNIAGRSYHGTALTTIMERNAVSGPFFGSDFKKYADLSSLLEYTATAEYPYKVDFDASRVVPTAEENRPKNVALNYIIKAFNTTTDTETLPIQMAKALNNKIENNYNDQLDATVDIVGKEFYDYIQNPGEKTAGKIYRDRLQKGIFRCLKTTTSVLNTSEFYESISNNDLLGKLQNLCMPIEIIPIKACLPIFAYKIGNYLTCSVRIETGTTNVMAGDILFRLPFPIPSESIRSTIVIGDGSADVIEFSNIINELQDVKTLNGIKSYRRASFNFTIKLP